MQVVLRNNGNDPFDINADGQFTFPVPVAEGGNYTVTIASLPVGQTCYVVNAAGFNVRASVTNIKVQCQNNHV